MHPGPQGDDSQTHVNEHEKPTQARRNHADTAHTAAAHDSVAFGPGALRVSETDGTHAIPSDQGAGLKPDRANLLELPSLRLDDQAEERIDGHRVLSKVHRPRSHHSDVVRVNAPGRNTVQR